LIVVIKKKISIFFESHPMKNLEKIFLLNWYKNENIDLVMTKEPFLNSKSSDIQITKSADQKNIHDQIELNNINNINELLEVIESKKISDLENYSSNSCIFEGSTSPEILIVNDYPDEEEEKSKKIFSNQCEILIKNMLNAISVDFDKTARINVFFWRTPDNRRPSTQEIKDCNPFVKKIIELLSPKFIISLGEVATSSILEESVNMIDVRGKSFDSKYGNIKIYPLFHPRILIKQPTLKRLAWEDLKIIKENL
jgi:DNA polymerase